MPPGADTGTPEARRNNPSYVCSGSMVLPIGGEVSPACVRKTSLPLLDTTRSCGWPMNVPSLVSLSRSIRRLPLKIFSMSFSNV